MPFGFECDGGGPWKRTEEKRRYAIAKLRARYPKLSAAEAKRIVDRKRLAK